LLHKNYNIFRGRTTPAGTKHHHPLDQRAEGSAHAPTSSYSSHPQRISRRWPR